MSRFCIRLGGVGKAGIFACLLAAPSLQAQAPAAPTLATPGDEAASLTTAQFSWAASSGATSYHLQLSKTYNFAAPVVDDSTLVVTTRSAPLDLRTVSFWRVRAKNGSGVSAWSAIRSFTSSVPLPAPDSAGWIKVFRGDNTAEFFQAGNVSTPPGRVLTTFPSGPYSVTGDTIRVSGNPAGQFYFKQPFSHYKVRYQMRFPNFTGTGNGGTGNCGMLLHVQAQDNPTNGFPRSVEAQGDPTQGMGQLWAIGDVWVTVRARTVSGRQQYDSTQPEIDHGGKNWDSPSRVAVGADGWAMPTFASQQQDGWVTQEAHVYGSDSVIHLVNGVPRIKYRNLRVSTGGTPNNVSKMLSKGLIAWQSEGTSVWYRNLEIQLLPGDSLYTTSIAGSRPEARATSEAPRLMMGKGSPVFEMNSGTSGSRKSTYDLRGRNLNVRDAVPGVPAAEQSNQEKKP
jgi:hypothetical protein